MLTQKEDLKAWAEIFDFPLPGRCPKPRHLGQTMVIDKGLGLSETSDLLDLAADYIDYIKLGFGTSAFYSTKLLQDKIKLVKSYGVDIYPGGTFFEVALLQGNFDAYLQKAQELGFETIEISDGTINISDEVRAKVVKRAHQCGFKVITEVGKKDPKNNPSNSQIACYVNMDLANGAYKVIVEGRESGKGIGVFDNSGSVKHDELEEIIKGVNDPQNIIWEAPLKNQQETLIKRFGTNVNLGNIQPNEILALESLRVGLRADTLQMAIENNTPSTHKQAHPISQPESFPLNPEIAGT